jgi:hypothetical protein
MFAAYRNFYGNTAFNIPKRRGGNATAAIAPSAGTNCPESYLMRSFLMPKFGGLSAWRDCWLISFCSVTR